MYTKTKKLISTLLTLALALSLFVAMPVTASAAQPELTWTILLEPQTVRVGDTVKLEIAALCSWVPNQLPPQGQPVNNIGLTSHKGWVYIASDGVIRWLNVSGNNLIKTADSFERNTTNHADGTTLTFIANDLLNGIQISYVVCPDAMHYFLFEPPVTITVMSNSPVITRQPASQSLTPDRTSASFEVQATGSGTLSYQWYEVSGTSPMTVTNGGMYSGATTNKLTATSDWANLTGKQYQCKVTNKDGNCEGVSVYSETAKLTTGYITPPPVTITQQPVNRSIAVGQSTSFSVSAANALSYRWQELRASGGQFAAWFDIPNGGIYTGATTATLNLTNVPAAYNGYQYRCVVSDAVDSVTSKAATLTIEGAISTPVIDTQPENSSITAGQSVSFGVAATGALSYQWQELPNLGGFSLWQNISNGGIYSGATSATLSLSNVPANYNGARYRCVVRGTAGSVTSSEATLTVTEATTPPTITGPTTMSLPAGYPATSTTVFTITGTPDPNVSKTSGHASITWNNSTKKLDIAAGLAAGNYPVVLTATSGANTVTFTFTLTVTPAPSTGGSMDNFNPPVNNYTPGMFTDVDENAWYGFNQQGVIANAYNYGLMTGTSATTFHPTGNMSVAEAITVAARVHSIYMTGAAVFVTGSPWYQVYVDYAISKDIIKATDFTNYTRSVTRAEMAYIFSRCLPAAEFPAQNTVNSLPDVNNSTPYKDEIFMLYKAGVVQGTGTPGTFYPSNNIIRAEAAAIISRVILPLTRFSGRTFG